MKILSLFDGMGCGRLALNNLGVKVNGYYSSEIDKPANKVTKTKWSDIVQLGDVTRWKEWNINWSEIDLILSGSPCQGFSFAGKQLAFDDPRSALFFVFVDILRHCQALNPNVHYLLENVKMKKEHEHVISRILNVNPLEINSALVSAQNRVRLYWTSINQKPFGLFGDKFIDIPQPEDLGILLKDILESEVDEKYYLKGQTLKRLLNENPSINPEKSYAVITKNNTESGSRSRTMTLIKKAGKIKPDQNKASCFTAGGNSGGNHSDMDLIVHNMMPRSSKNGNGGTGHLTRTDGKTYCLDTGKTNAVEYDYRIRRLTPIECCRLQNVPDDYFFDNGNPIVSETQMYKMLGNGWNVKTIEHILKYLIQ